MIELTNFQKIYLLIYYMKTKGNMPKFNGYLNEVFTQSNINEIASALTQSKLHETKEFKSIANKHKIAGELARILSSNLTTIVNQKFGFLPKSPLVMLNNHYRHQIATSIRRNLDLYYARPFETKNDIDFYGLSIYPYKNMQMLSGNLTDQSVINKYTNDTQKYLKSADVENFKHNTTTRINITLRTNMERKKAEIFVPYNLISSFKQFLERIPGVSYSQKESKFFMSEESFYRISPYFVFWTTNNIKSNAIGSGDVQAEHHKDNTDGNEAQTNSLMDIAAANNSEVKYSEKETEDSEINGNTSPENNTKLLVAQILNPEVTLNVKTSPHKVLDVNKYLFKALLSSSPKQIERLKNDISSASNNVINSFINRFTHGKSELQDRMENAKKMLCVFARNINTMMTFEEQHLNKIHVTPKKEFINNQLSTANVNLITDILALLKSSSIHTIDAETLAHYIESLKAISINEDAKDLLLTPMEIQYVVIHLLNEEYFNIKNFTTIRSIYQSYDKIKWVKIESPLMRKYFEIFLRPVFYNFSYIAASDNQWKYKESRFTIEKEPLKEYTPVSNSIVSTQDIINSINEYIEQLKPSYNKISVFDYISTLISDTLNVEKVVPGYPDITDEQFEDIMDNVENILKVSNKNNIHIIYPLFIKASIMYLEKYATECETKLSNQISEICRENKDILNSVIDKADGFTNDFGTNIPKDTVLKYINELYTVHDDNEPEATVIVRDDSLQKIRESAVLLDAIIKLANTLKLPEYTNKTSFTVGDLMSKQSSDDIVNYLVSILGDIVKVIEPDYDDSNKTIEEKIGSIKDILSNVSLINKYPLTKGYISAILNNSRIDMLSEFDFTILKAFILSKTTKFNEYNENMNAIRINPKMIMALSNRDTQVPFSRLASRNKYRLKTASCN